jgi:murein L,D-transpeptidase YcbB/YkuD
MMFRVCGYHCENFSETIARDARSIGMNTKDKKTNFPKAAIIIVVAVAAALALNLALNVQRLISPENSPVHQAETGALQKPAPEKVERTAIAPASVPIAARLEQEPAATRTVLTQIYEPFSFAPLWVSRNNEKRLKSLHQAMAAAEDQGIKSERLQRLIETAKTEMPDDATAHTDVALTREALSLAIALRLGAVPVQQMGPSWVMPAEIYDPVPGLVEALKKGDVSGLFAQLPPQDEQYRNLVTALQTYREIAAEGGWPRIPGDEEVRLDTNDARIPMLAARLKAEGYNVADLTEAVKTFQMRNGLEPDGRIGRGTLAALNISANDRIAQIAANLERRRHTQRDLGADYIAVNTAAAVLDLYRNGKSVLQLKTVTGKPRHATPILSAKITHVVLNPRWEIPASIAGNEILPKLQQNPNYLAENNMVIVNPINPDDPHGQYLDWSQFSHRSLPMRFRQQPGDDNALGTIKFQMANPQNIYIHDTPSRSAFAKYDRHLSHGCVRVEQPTVLAQHVLEGTNDWDAGMIEQEIATNGTQTIALKKPLPVYTFYWTALVESDGVHFSRDVYKRDMAIAKALGIESVPEKQKDRLIALD